MFKRFSMVLLLALFSLVAPLAPARAADHAALNETIWPSQNDIAQTAGDGKKLLENQWAKPTAVFAVNNYSLTGLTVPASDADLNINVALGTAYIAGRHINIPAATSVTATASTTNFVFLKLTRDGSNLVTGASFEVNTTGTPPADSTPIATLTAGASSISATTDLRILPTTITVLTSGTSWTVPAGITQIYVEVFGASGGGGGGHGDNPGENGGNGGAGGTTSFGALTVTGGAGGPGSPFAHAKTVGAAHGVGSGGSIGMTGGGKPGGALGHAANSTARNGTARDGGAGGISAGYLSVTPNTAITIAIGAAGTAGTAGDAVVADPGIVGLAGVITIQY